MAIKIDTDSVYTVEDLSEMLGIQERTVREYVKEGKLKGRKLARRWYITGRSIMDYIEAGPQAGEDLEE